MSPAAGQRLGPYEIVAPLGAGGMGEVWRARDTRLDRSVAIKMLPAALAGNAQLRARFEREARSISQLAHPNICSLYDVGDNYLVMELIDGESLAGRLARGPLPVDQALRIGIEISSALQCAHRSGIVHRDLKPGNVMLSKSGAKLLDFGLAKPLSDASMRPVSTSATQQQPLTEEGMIVGTYYYMSPEQLTGGVVDARSDIFALGALLYEMVAGRRAFEGKTKTSVIASILDRDPPALTEVNPEAPPPLARVVASCLAKDPDDRWQSAHDVGLELKTLRDGVSSASAAAAMSPRRRLFRAAAIGTVVALAAAGGFFASRRFTPVRASMHLGVVPPPGKAIIDFTLSPRGDLAVLAAFSSDHESLWIYDLSTGKSREIENTVNGTEPFWSPDGHWIAFLKEDSLYKVAANGGAPLLIYDRIGFMFGGTWAADDTILLGLDGKRGIMRLAASGGALTPITRVDPSHRETGHMWPVFLPDGRHFLYLADADAAEDHELCVGSLDSREPARRLLSVMSNADYADGYLLYGKARTLMAQPFDPDSLQLSGEPRVISDQLADTDFHHYVFSAARGGAIGFSTFDPRSRLHLTDRTGKELAAFGDPADWVSVTWSPDARYAMLERVEAERRGGKLWLADLTRRSFNEFTESPAYGGLWSPDSTQVLYASSLPPVDTTFVRKIDGSQARQIPTVKTSGFISTWVGDWVAVEAPGKSNPADVDAISMSDGKHVTIANSPLWENDAAFSADGRWIAYNMASKIVVQPFPPTGATFTVSSTFGSHPRWRRDGKELYYAADTGVLAVPIEVKGTSIEAGTPQLLFSVILKSFKNRPPYDVSPDGQRFLLNIQDSYERPAHVILDWTAALH
jgi:Tol biopolymer transport system component